MLQKFFQGVLEKIILKQSEVSPRFLHNAVLGYRSYIEIFSPRLALRIQKFFKPAFSLGNIPVVSSGIRTGIFSILQRASRGFLQGFCWKYPQQCLQELRQELIQEINFSRESCIITFSNFCRNFCRNSNRDTFKSSSSTFIQKFLQHLHQKYLQEFCHRFTHFSRFFSQ